MAKRRSARADKTKKAAAHGFEKWYKEEEGKMNRGTIPCKLEDSPLYEDMKRTPHMLLYFLLNVLQRLVDQFWQSSAASEPYVTMCVAAMSKCPPCIIGLLVYLRYADLFPATVSAFPPTSKDRIFWSELARATARSEASASASASTSAAAGNDEDEFAAFWLRFDDNVMQHLVWPAVRAGEITQPPKAQLDNPTWWTDGIAPILEDERVYKLYWRGGKKKATNCWTHVCAVLARHDFVALETREAFRQKTVDDFLVAAGYFVGPAASNSTGNDETQEGEAEVAYLTAPAAASPAGDAAIEKAFWSVFADDVMEHLVWPAVHKGHINAAPKAVLDNPEWWARGILPILQDPRVCMLHWKGGKEAARSCWTFVCEQLAGHVFLPPAAGEAFTQKS